MLIQKVFKIIFVLLSSCFEKSAIDYVHWKRLVSNISVTQLAH